MENYNETYYHQYYDKIVSYINNNLSESATKALEQEIKNDAELAHFTGLVKLEQETIHLKLKQDLKDNFNKWDKELEIKRRRSIVFIIIGLIISTIAGYYIWNKINTTPKTNEYYAELMETIAPENSTIRGSETGENDTILIQFYDTIDNSITQDKYNEAIQTCKKFKENHSNNYPTTNEKLDWLIAKYHFLNQEPTKAIIQLKTIATRKNHDYQREAEKFLEKYQ